VPILKSYQSSAIVHWTARRAIPRLEDKESAMILITGASGNVGQEVLAKIAKMGRPIRAAYQSAAKAALAPAGVETVILDYNRAETVRAALRNVERVFLVGPVTPELPELERKATDEIKRSGVRQIVKLSAMGGQAATFPRQHEESENYIRASGVAYTFLRPNGFMQNMVNYNGETIRSQNAFYGTQGGGEVSHIDLRDIAAVAVRVLTEDGHAGKVYTLTGPEALTNSRIAGILSSALGREIKYVDLPPEQMKQALLAAMPEWNAKALLDLNELYRLGGASAVIGDVEQILGRKATTFEQFARDYSSSFQAS
jgi:uncharacterized protein YbjT (DUF2867 family)